MLQLNHTNRPQLHSRKDFPFREIRFIRLDDWQENRTESTCPGGDAFGGRIFHSYELKGSKSVRFDFFYTGAKLPRENATEFLNLLAQDGPLTIRTVESLARQICPRIRPDYIIWAEVGAINRKKAIVIEWQDRQSKLRLISVFYDVYGDGKTVHQLHFRAAYDRFEATKEYFYRAVRSVQWSQNETQTWMKFHPGTVSGALQCNPV